VEKRPTSTGIGVALEEPGQERQKETSCGGKRDLQ